MTVCVLLLALSAIVFPSIFGLLEGYRYHVEASLTPRFNRDATGSLMSIKSAIAHQLRITRGLSELHTCSGRFLKNIDDQLNGWRDRRFADRRSPLMSTKVRSCTKIVELTEFTVFLSGDWIRYGIQKKSIVIEPIERLENL